MSLKNLPYERLVSQREPLSQQVSERIIELIATNHLKPGDMLPSQQELSDLFGVSRTVVREGLQALSGMGVIRVSQGIRAQVIKADPAALAAIMRISAGAGTKGMENLLAVRGILEPEVAALAAIHASLNDIDRMREAVVSMDGALDDVSRFIDADEQFHISLAEATGNELLSRITSPVVNLLQEMRRIAVQAPGAMQRAQVWHHAILENVQGRDPVGARSAMQSHLTQIRGEIGIETGNLSEENSALTDQNPMSPVS